MSSAKDLFDITKDFGSFLDALASTAESHPLIATIIILALVVFLCLQLVQNWKSIEQIWRWVSIPKIQRGKLGFVLILLLGLGAASYYARSLLVDSRRPNPTGLEPNESITVWGDRILLKWSPPLGQTIVEKFQIQIRQGDKRLELEANRSELPLFAHCDSGIGQGEFFWRVRAIQPISNWSAWKRAVFYRDRLARIRQTNLIRIGLFADELPPYAYSDQNSPDGVDGLEVHIGRYLANDISKRWHWPSQLKAVFERSQWLRGNVEDLQSGKVDIVIANTSASKKREKEYNVIFSEPYLRNRLAFVSDADRAFGHWRDLVSKRVAIWEGSTAHEILSALGAKPRHYDSTSQMFDALAKGHVDAILDDEWVMKCNASSASGIRYHIQEYEGTSLDLSFEYPERISAYVLNDGSGARLLDEVNQTFKSDEFKAWIEEQRDLFFKSKNCRP